MKRFLYISPLLLAIVIGGFSFWGLSGGRDPNAIPSVLISQPVPDFALPSIEGMATEGLSSGDLANLGQPALVNVFASWCVPCRAEHPILTRMAEEDGVLLYGINYKDRPDAARAWLEELGNPYAQIGADFPGRVSIDWGVTGVPETFVIGADGTVVYRFAGPIVGADAVAKLEAALAEARAAMGQS
ncbi:MAG: DsbE family thiol:disulfide interchange protein [Pseudomonadota bacterium]